MEYLATVDDLRENRGQRYALSQFYFLPYDNMAQQNFAYRKEAWMGS